MAKVKPVPEGFHTVTPYLVVDDGARAIDFYQQAFGAKDRKSTRLNSSHNGQSRMPSSA